MPHFPSPDTPALSFPGSIPYFLFPHQTYISNHGQMSLLGSPRPTVNHDSDCDAFICPQICKVQLNIYFKMSSVFKVIDTWSMSSRSESLSSPTGMSQNHSAFLCAELFAISLPMISVHYRGTR